MCLEDLLNRGWIVPSESNYALPVISVQKKSETLQSRYHYRVLNANIHAD